LLASPSCFMSQVAVYLCQAIVLFLWLPLSLVPPLSSPSFPVGFTLALSEARLF